MVLAPYFHCIFFFYYLNVHSSMVLVYPNFTINILRHNLKVTDRV